MGKTHVRTSLALLGVAAATGAAAAALPNVSPVWATSSLPAPAGGSPPPVELSRTTAPSGVLVLSGQPGNNAYTTLGCRFDGAEVARTTYELFKAPKSNRWLVYVGAISYGQRGVFSDLAAPSTERQFNQAVKRARHRLRLPGVKGEVFASKADAVPLSVVATKVKGKRPTAAERVDDAEAVLGAGDPFQDQ